MERTPKVKHVTDSELTGDNYILERPLFAGKEFLQTHTEGLERIDSLTDRLNYLVEIFNQLQFSPGYYLQVFDASGSGLFAYCQGNIDNRSDQIKQTTDSVFDLASISKVVSIAAYLWALENNRYHLPGIHTTLGEINESFAHSPVLSGLRLHQLITHNSQIRHLTWKNIAQFTGTSSIKRHFYHSHSWGGSEVVEDYRCHNIMLLVFALEEYLEKQGKIYFRDIVQSFIDEFELGFVIDQSKLDPSNTAQSTNPITKESYIGNHDWKGYYGMVGPSGVFASAQQLKRFLYRLMNNEFYNTKQYITTFGEANTTSNIPPGYNHDRLNGSRFNYMGLRQSYLIPHPWLYAQGHTGPFIAYHTELSRYIILTMNPRQQRSVLTKNILENNFELRVPINSLLCKAVAMR